jgi:hypothetical protein
VLPMKINIVLVVDNCAPIDWKRKSGRDPYERAYTYARVCVYVYVHYKYMYYKCTFPESSADPARADPHVSAGIITWKNSSANIISFMIAPLGIDRIADSHLAKYRVLKRRSRLLIV